MILKVGVQVCERSERNFFDPPPPPPLAYLGDIKQDYTIFIAAIMACKCLCLSAPNDYNSGLWDYYDYGYGETETVKECHFRVLITVYYINVMSSLQIVSTECLQVVTGRSQEITTCWVFKIKNFYRQMWPGGQDA